MTVSLRIAALFSALLLAAGCGASDPGSDGSPPRSGPPGPPPTIGGDGPPPAWLEARDGAHWLGYATYCWGGTCADYVEPSCSGGRRVPAITVRRGETVTAHLGFEPEELTLSFFSGDLRPTYVDERKLPPTKTPSWTVKRDGVFWLFATTEGGDASYVACLRVAH